MSTVVSVQLFRDSLSTLWGFRLYGGADLRCPLTVQKVTPCSPSEGELCKGDVLQAIGDVDATEISHEEAESIIRKAGGSIALTVLRRPQPVALPFTPVAMATGRYGPGHKVSNQQNFGVDFRRIGHPAPTPTNTDAAYLELQRSLNMAANLQQPTGLYRAYSLDQPTLPQPPALWRQTSQDAPLSSRPIEAVRVQRQPPNRTGPTSTATAAHLQYNSPLQLYSRNNAEAAKNAQLGDHPAADTLKLTGGNSKTDLLDSPTLRMVLKEDAAKAKLGRAPGPAFYARQHEFGPGIGPIRQYCETPVDEEGLSDF